MQRSITVDEVKRIASSPALTQIVPGVDHGWVKTAHEQETEREDNEVVARCRPAHHRLSPGGRGVRDPPTRFDLWNERLGSPGQQPLRGLRLRLQRMVAAPPDRAPRGACRTGERIPALERAARLIDGWTSRSPALPDALTAADARADRTQRVIAAAKKTLRTFGAAPYLWFLMGEANRLRVADPHSAATSGRSVPLPSTPSAPTRL